MNETDEATIELLEARRALAVKMLNAFAAGAFEQPHTPEDVAYCKEEIADCDKQIAALRVGDAY